LAISTEDAFDEMFTHVTLRDYTQHHNLDRSSIKIHGLGGASPARDHTRFHNAKPTKSLPAVALLDGDKRQEDGFYPKELLEDESEGSPPIGVDITFGPGDGSPEAAVFGQVLQNLDKIGNLIGKLTLAMQLDTPRQARVRASLEERASTNRTDT
jgi:hypothetical protein